MRQKPSTQPRARLSQPPLLQKVRICYNSHDRIPRAPQWPSPALNFFHQQPNPPRTPPYISCDATRGNASREGQKGPREKSSQHPVDKPADRDIIRDPTEGTQGQRHGNGCGQRGYRSAGFTNASAKSGCRRFSRKRDGLVSLRIFGCSLTSE
jgi:hypothetical protein